MAAAYVWRSSSKSTHASPFSRFPSSSTASGSVYPWPITLFQNPTHSCHGRGEHLSNVWGGGCLRVWHARPY